MINLSDFFKNKDSLLVNTVFYFSCAILIVIIFGYLALEVKVYIQNQGIDEINKRMVGYSLYQQRIDENSIIDYKKKIDDFSLIIKNHKVSSNVFNFIEENTMSNVWFSNFDMSQSTYEIKLSGEAENIETLSDQIQTFENNKDNVKNINVLNSRVDANGKIRFLLSISLNPEIYSYIKK